jgi:hypothetical protein
MNKFLKSTSIAVLLIGASSPSFAQQIQGLNSISGLICAGCTITNPTITGGTIDNTPIGQTTQANGAFSFLGSGDQTSPTGQTILNSLLSTNTAAGSVIGLRKSAATANPASIVFLKSRGTAASPSVVTSGDDTAAMTATSFDGTNYITSSQIRMSTEGTISTGIVPGNIKFFTTNSSGSSTEAARFDSSQRTLLGYTFDQGGGQKLQVNGGALISGNLTLGASATFGPTSGSLTVTSNGTFVFGGASTSLEHYFTATGAGTDVGTWDHRVDSTGFAIRALNDAKSSNTLAYLITRGTTYNVAKHDWYTSTTAGTAVQGMELGTGGLTIGDGTYRSFVAASPSGAAWVNYLSVNGNTTGNSIGLNAVGSDTNVGMNFTTKGTSPFAFITGGGSRTQFAILDNASGADYVTVTSGASAGVINTNAGNLNIGSTGGTTTLSDATVALTNAFAVNGAVATSLGSVGPTGSHTTVQQWLKITLNGTVGYIPVF